MAVDMKNLVVQVAGMFLVIGLVMFFSAGTAAWPAGWAFLLLFFVFTVAISAWLVKHNPGLLTERLTGFSKADRKQWDRVVFVILYAIFLGWLILMPLDAVRFGWSNMPGWLQVVGAVLLLVSFYLFFLIFRANAFLSPVVRIQAEREQTVATGGPYRWVRHPMYATAAVWLVGTTLLLGSWYGFAMALLLLVAIAYRAVQEERMLREELPGYAEYMQQVKHRLIPYVW